MKTLKGGQSNGLLYSYVAAIFFFDLGLQAGYMILVYRTGFGLNVLPEPREPWQDMSFVRMMLWVPAIILFWTSSAFLVKRSRKAVIYLAAGIVLYLAGNAWDEYLSIEAIGSAVFTLD